VSASKHCFTWQGSLNRKPFKQLEDKDVEYFKSFLSKHSIVTDPIDLEPHNQDFTKMIRGSSKLLLCPHTT
jgi:FAD/FMN-containing dehydrogenase